MKVCDYPKIRSKNNLASIARETSKDSPRKMTSVELFVGAGGLALGVAKAGFRHLAVVEKNKNACATIRENQARNHELVRNWPLYEADVRDFNFRQFEGKVDLLAGGPPCQPFSLGGKHRGNTDDRDMFPEMIRAVKEIQPKFLLVENVKGLLRTSFAPYFDYILKRLEQPCLDRLEGENWEQHYSRLKKSTCSGELRYRLAYKCINTADYGVPQKRWRVIILGVREDLGITPTFPEPTHSEKSLLWDQWVTGDYWKKHSLTAPELPHRLESRINKLSQRLFPPELSPWCTVRDAFAGLPDAEFHASLAQDFLNHTHNPGAKSYPGHTGSPLDLPSKALKAGDHGVPGGENMLVRLDESIRYFTVRESSRLQCFPDDYFFPGSWTNIMKQLGNAVPCSIGEIFASRFAKILSNF